MDIAATLTLAVICLAALGLAGLAAAGWYLSEQLRLLALLPPRISYEYGLEVVDVEEGQCTLGVASSSGETAHRSRPVIPKGVWGLEWDGGYAQTGPEPEYAGDRATCHLLSCFDAPDPGELARIDMFAYPDDPLRAFEIPFREVFYRSPLGKFPAWQVDGEGDTWVIAVHGRGAPLRECLRYLPILAGLGLPMLAVTYRNDAGVPASPDGFHRYGITEWQDVEGAVRYALERGAKSVVLMGHSMGGGITASFMYRSPLKDKVRCLVLDSPMLDLNLIVRNGARQFGLLRLLTPLGKLVSSMRFGINWRELDYVQRASELDVPVLLFHSAEDNITPVETSRRFLLARPDIVEYVPFEDAYHACGWNRDPERYEGKLRDFLARHSTRHSCPTRHSHKNGNPCVS